VSIEPLQSGDFPFPLAEPRPAPVMVSRPCGCTSMVVDDVMKPMQVSWCVEHDPGYEPPQVTIAHGDDTACDRCGHPLPAGAPAWPDGDGVNCADCAQEAAS
jgi:hypothetical protein